MSITDSRTASTRVIESTSTRSTLLSRTRSGTSDLPGPSHSSAQNPGVEPTTQSSIRSTSDPLLSATTQRNVETSSRTVVVTETTMASCVSLTTSSSSTTSSLNFTTSLRTVTTASSRSAGPQASSSISSSSSSSGSSSITTTTASSPTSVAPSPTTTSTFSNITSAPNSTSRTLITSSSAFDISASIQSTSLTKSDPTITSDPSATPTSNPDAPPSTSPATHDIIIDLGTCGNMGFPKVIDNSDGSQYNLEILGNNQYGVSLETDEWNGREVIVFLGDSGERCGEAGTCTSLLLWFDLDSLSVEVSRAGDRGLNMYPLSMWVDGGELYDGTPADSQASKYNCWGWAESECPFSYMYRADPQWTISSTSPNSTAYITFCPPDGPAVSSIGPNPNPPSTDPNQEGTNVILPTDTTVPVSTFWAPLTSQTTVGAASPTPDATSMDAAAWSAFCATEMALTCIVAQTFLPIDETTTVPFGPPKYASLLTTTTSGVVGPVIITASPPDYGPTVLFSTYFELGTTTLVPISTVIPTPTRPREGSSALVTGIPITVTDSLDSPIVTSTTSSITTLPVSAATDNRGSAVTTISSDLITTPPPSSSSPAQKFYTLTSWTTHSIVNGSTIPIVGGQVGVLSTVPVTYVLEPGTTIAVGDLSSISVESTRTSMPSASANAEARQAGSSRESKIAGAIVGSLVGLTLLSLLFWAICFRRKRAQRTSDYVGNRAPMWSSGTGSGAGLAEGSGSGNGSELDLSDEARPRDSFVQPWVAPHSETQASGSSTSRKMQREMGEYGGGLVSASAGPSRSRTGVSSSVGRSYSAFQHSKSANRVPPELQPEPLAHWPVRTNTLSSIHSSQDSSPSSMPAAPVRSPSQPTLVPTEPQSQPRPQSPPASRRYSNEGLQHNAIPPRYNEAWNTQRSPSSE